MTYIQSPGQVVDSKRAAANHRSDSSLRLPPSGIQHRRERVFREKLRESEGERVKYGRNISIHRPIEERQLRIVRGSRLRGPEIAMSIINFDTANLYIFKILTRCS
jgi:hypothetical protein